MCEHEWGLVEDGYQYCKKCGEAKTAPPKGCDHVWEEKATHDFYLDIDHSCEVGIVIILECEKCGCLWEHKIYLVENY
jgi:hypothetical protein